MISSHTITKGFLMKTFVTVLLAMILLSVIASAQWVETSGPSGGFVSKFVTNPTNGYVFALAGGDVYRSTDAGATWTSKTITLQANIGITAIAVSGTNVYIGVGSGNTTNILFRSSDNGDTWNIPTATGIPAYYTPTTMIVAGSKLLMYAPYLLGGGKIFASTDGGDNWTESSTGLPANLSVGFFAMKGSDIYAAGSIISSVKGIYKSTDNGVNWVPSNTTLGGITGLSANSSFIFVATSTTGVFRCSGNDTVWTKINPSSTIPGTNFATSVLATSTNLFIGITGYMYRADQSGNTWDSIRVGLPQPTAGTAIRSLAVSGSSVMLGFASHGIFRSTNNGTNWFKSTGGLKAEKINGVYSSNGYLFAAGDADGFFRSNDHGDTWTEINNGLPADAGYYCFARVGTDLLGGTASSSLFRSSDNGDNWTLSNTGFGLTNTFAFWVEGNTVYSTGLPGVAKSTDGGLIWVSLPAGYLSYEAGLDIWKDGSNILTGSNLANHRSTDEGGSWSAATGAVSAFTQIDSTLFSATATGVKKSTDHGATWTATAALPFTVSSQSLTAKGDDLFVGTNDGVYRSTDKGGTWTAINQGWASKYTVYKITYDDQYLYAGTTNRSVWRRPLSEITAVKEVSKSIPMNFELEQNYPNPFNPTTQFQFAISKLQMVTVKIYDVLGREVATLVNEELHPGTYQAKWDASGQPSGVYYYRLQAGSFSEMKKMVLMK
jgi:photosystem II stability/assembly factor-like uncharacterized protein